MSTHVKVARVVFASEDFFKEESSRVFVELWELGSHSHRTSNARLMPDPQILERYEHWRKAYQTFYKHLRFRDEGDLADKLVGLQRDTPIELQARKKNLEVCSSELVSAFNHWLSSQPSFRNGVENWLSDRFNLEDSEIRIAIESDDPNVRRLPWQAWNLLSRFEQAELSIGDTRHDNFGSVPSPVGDSRHLKLLAVLGYEGGLDLERDRQTIQALSNIETKFLYQPSLQELKAELSSARWDSFYFGGHSASNEDGSAGVLYLNSQGPVEISQLKRALKIAIRQGGLQLGIFNSCDGLGLAAELEEVHFPLSIVMREPVPNVVAQRFLTYFLQAFTSGKPLYLALRQARLLLEDNSDELPYVSWLPAIAHDSSTTPLLWQNRSGEQADLASAVPSQPQGQSSGLERATTVVRSHNEASTLQAASQSRTILAGAYEILDSLSSGGFSVTYVAKALDLPGQPKCAIKQLKPMSPKVDLEKAREWFELEAQILFELGSSTDRIPTFYARFEEGGEFYLVQEFIDGEELEKELRLRGRLSEYETLELLQTILEGLEIVHRKSIIHRDIKPSNLMRRKSDGKIVLIDFGAVKEVIAMATQTGAEFRRQGSIVGSPGFMAPEQSSGYPLLASDIFSVGAIALRAVTGIAPMQVFSAEGKTGRLIRQDSVQVSEEMANLLNSMTHIDPESRFPNAALALQAVRQFMQSLERDSVTDTLPGSASSVHRSGPTGGGQAIRNQQANEPKPKGNVFNRLFGRKPSPPPSKPQTSSSTPSSSTPSSSTPSSSRPASSTQASAPFMTGPEAVFSNPEAGSSRPDSASAADLGSSFQVDETLYVGRSESTPQSGALSQPTDSLTPSGTLRQPPPHQTDYERLRNQLTAVLGPMGTVVLKQAMDEASTVEDAIARIARSMPAQHQESFRNWATQTLSQLPLANKTDVASSRYTKSAAAEASGSSLSSPFSPPSGMEQTTPEQPESLSESKQEVPSRSVPQPPAQPSQPVSIVFESTQNNVRGSDLVDVTLSQQQIEQLGTRLAEYLGPMAGVTIANVLQSVGSQQEFIDALLGWLPSDAQPSFRQFAEQVCSQPSSETDVQRYSNPSTMYFERSQTIVGSDVADSNTVGSNQNLANTPAQWVQDTSFLDLCYTELAKHIGPIAAVAIKQALNNSSSTCDRNAFIEELASHLTNPDSAAQFKEFLRQK
ncbi:MAG: serine/threonine-protein kinase [Cyanobacteria bacterium P01_E01_bin.34]